MGAATYHPLGAVGGRVQIHRQANLGFVRHLPSSELRDACGVAPSPAGRSGVRVVYPIAPW